MLLTHPYKHFSANKPWTARLLLTIFVLLILLASLRAIMPFALKSAAIFWFESNGVEATVGEIEIALFDGRFAMNDVATFGTRGKQLSLGRIAVIWQWKPLLDRKVVIPRIEIGGVKMDASVYANGEKNIGGIIIKSAAEDAAQAKVEETGAPWDIDVQNITITDVEVCLQQFTVGKTPDVDYCATLAAFDWQGDIQFKQSKQAEVGEAVPLFVGGALNLSKLAVKDNKLNLNLLKLGGLGLTPISMKTLQKIEIGEFALRDFSALQRKDATATHDAQIVSLDSLWIKPVLLSQMNNLKLGRIQLIGAQAFFRIDKQGKNDLAYWFPTKSEAAAANQAEKTARDTETKTPAEVNKKQSEELAIDSKPFRYAFDEFILNSDKHIIFVDDSLKESFAVDVHSVVVSFGKLDSSVPDSVSRLVLSLKVDKHGLLKIEADMTPLAKQPSIAGKGEIAGLDLRSFAPFTKQHIGHNVRSGQLDADLKLAVNKGIIDSNMKLALHHFELKALSKKEAKELDSEFGFPLNSSLSLLRDRDNTIRLEIPVAGDVDNPEFDPSDAIVKASSKAITTAVVQYYTPFGLVFAANKLFDLAKAMNFEPLMFEANQSVLSEVHHAQLDKLSTLLAERPGVHLTLCGVSNMQDKDVLLPASANQGEENDKKNVTTKSVDTNQAKPLSKEDLELLKKLAHARSANVKDYLVHTKKIKASRLVECAPEFEAEGISGVEISI